MGDPREVRKKKRGDLLLWRGLVKRGKNLGRIGLVKVWAKKFACEGKS